MAKLCHDHEHVYPPRMTTRDAAVVMVFHQGNVLAVTRPVGGFALPGGGIEPNEPPAIAARRELFEETGLLAPELVPLGMRQGGRGIVHAFYAPAVFGFLSSSPEGVASFVPIETVLEGPYGQSARDFLFAFGMSAMGGRSPGACQLQTYAVN